MTDPTNYDDCARFTIPLGAPNGYDLKVQSNYTDRFAPRGIAISKNCGALGTELGCDLYVGLTEPAAESAGDAEEAEDTAVRERLRHTLAGLPETHRIAVTLRYLEGMDHASIERTMGVSNGALRGILGRALGTLRRMPALQRSNP